MTLTAHTNGDYSYQRSQVHSPRSPYPSNYSAFSRAGSYNEGYFQNIENIKRSTTLSKFNVYLSFEKITGG